MDKIRLSIVIPVYNLENYIAETLDSCLAQDILPEEYEIICIDDGSKDNSLAVLNHYAQTHSNIIVHTKENGGVSSARNKGIELAQGQYIWFVDGDDLIAENALGTLLRYAEDTSVDLFKFNSCHTTERTVCTAKLALPSICDVPDEIPAFMTAKGGIGGGVWCQLFRRELLMQHNLRFSEHIHYSEDILFSYRASLYSKRAAKTDSVLYYYYQRPNSALHNYNYKKHADSMHLLAREYYNMTQEYHTESVLKVLKGKIANSIKAMIFSLIQEGDPKLLRDNLDTATLEGLYPYPFLTESLRNNRSFKQGLINYLSFLFPCRWYAMFCVRMVALIKKVRK